MLLGSGTLLAVIEPDDFERVGRIRAAAEAGEAVSADDGLFLVERLFALNELVNAGQCLVADAFLAGAFVTDSGADGRVERVGGQPD